MISLTQRMKSFFKSSKIKKVSLTDLTGWSGREVAALTGHKLVVEQPAAEEDHGGR